MDTLNKEDNILYETFVEMPTCVSKGGKVMTEKNESILEIDQSDSH